MLQGLGSKYSGIFLGCGMQRSVVFLLAAAFLLGGCESLFSLFSNQKEEAAPAAAVSSNAEQTVIIKKPVINSMPSASPAAKNAARVQRQQEVRDEQAVVSQPQYFDYDQAELNDAAKAQLDRLVSFMDSYPAIRISVEGHCDQRGTREYNLALGERRANAVRNYLVGKGVSAARIQTISYGKERPAAFGTGEAVWRQNRRAEIVIK